MNSHGDSKEGKSEPVSQDKDISIADSIAKLSDLAIKLYQTRENDVAAQPEGPQKEDEKRELAELFDHLPADFLLRYREKQINELPQGDRRKALDLSIIPLKLQVRPWRGKSPSKRIKINEVCCRNEQINIAAICAGCQITMCDGEKREIREYYLLVPMKGLESPVRLGDVLISRTYERNKCGEIFQKVVNKAWGDELEGFPRTYVAQVYRLQPLQRHTMDKEFWEELRREGLFAFWDPDRGPLQFYRDHFILRPHLPILRVFEIDQDLGHLIDYHPTKVSHPPFLRKKGIEVSATPVLTDEEFKQQFDCLWKILQNPKYKWQP